MDKTAPKKGRVEPGLGKEPAEATQAPDEAEALADGANAALAGGELKFILHGRKLSGSWALVQMKGRGPKNWLLIKHKDEAARPNESIVDIEPNSALSGRTLDEIARG
jgi:hypothetical protein